MVYDHELHASFCVWCGLEYEMSGRWSLTAQDRALLERSKVKDKKTGEYRFSISSIVLGWQKYWETVECLENKHKVPRWGGSSVEGKLYNRD